MNLDSLKTPNQMIMKPKLNHAALAAVITLPFLFPALPAKGADAMNTNNSTANTNNSTAEVDNSKQNVRDRNNATLTSGDQGNSKTDLDLTSQIRKSVVSSTNNFSVMAQNIKIITVNGKVTLRGPVQTTEEKFRIAKTAQSIAGENNVSDQLEVKSNP
jgi:hyperosmotically inducible protein